MSNFSILNRLDWSILSTGIHEKSAVWGAGTPDWLLLGTLTDSSLVVSTLTLVSFALAQFHSSKNCLWFSLLVLHFMLALNLEPHIMLLLVCL